MGQPTKDDRLAAVHDRALKRFDTITDAVRNERLQCLQDRRFYSIAGAQWEGALGSQFENKPRFEMNKVHLAVIRIFNEYRNNRITVDFTAKDGSSNDNLADTCNGLYRADEQDSCAQEAYDNAFEEGVGGGFGAWRMRACYEDDEDEDDDKQRIRMEPIFDADSCVFFDLDAKRQDKSDATHCFVLTSMTPDAYEEEYGDDPASWPKEIHQREFDWATPACVYVAEYYEIEQKSELVHIFRGLALDADGEPNEMKVYDSELKDDPDKLTTLQATGFREVRQKRIKRTKVHKYILSGSKVLEDEGFIAGSCIPIVPFYGKRWFVDNVERCMGHVRLATDAQIMANMLRSWLAEISTMSPVEKPIVTPEQIKGHTQMWADDAIKRYPYLVLNKMVDQNGQVIATGPTSYTKAPSIPPAIAALLQITDQDLQDLLGNQQAGEEMQTNMSGKAVELIQTRLDMQVFIYMSNMAKAVQRSGQIWLSMAKDIYVEDMRKMKTLTSDGQVSSVQLMQPAYDADSGEQYSGNDMSQAKFDVYVDVGPSSSSRRAATVRALTGMMTITQDPDTLSVLNSMAMMNMEGEGLSDLRDYFRKKLVQLGAVKPTPEEQQEMQQAAQNQQPDPNAQYLQAAAEASVAKAGESKANTMLTMEKVKQTAAQTAQTVAETRSEHQDLHINAAKAIKEIATPPAVQSP